VACIARELATIRSPDLYIIQTEVLLTATSSVSMKISALLMYQRITLPAFLGYSSTTFNQVISRLVREPQDPLVVIHSVTFPNRRALGVLEVFVNLLPFFLGGEFTKKQKHEKYLCMDFLNLLTESARILLSKSSAKLDLSRNCTSREPLLPLQLVFHRGLQATDQTPVHQSRTFPASLSRSYTAISQLPFATSTNTRRVYYMFHHQTYGMVYSISSQVFAFPISLLVILLFSHRLRKNPSSLLNNLSGVSNSLQSAVSIISTRTLTLSLAVIFPASRTTDHLNQQQYYCLPGNRPDEPTGHLLDTGAPNINSWNLRLVGWYWS
jgi:hypothetical protein